MENLFRILSVGGSCQYIRVGNESLAICCSAVALEVLLYRTALAVVGYTLTQGGAGFAYICSGATANRARKFIGNSSPLELIHGFGRAVLHD